MATVILSLIMITVILAFKLDIFLILVIAVMTTIIFASMIAIISRFVILVIYFILNYLS